MRYPNRRYGSAIELCYWTQGQTNAEVGRRLFRSEECIRQWRNGQQPVPFWVCEVLRYRHEAAADLRRLQAIKTRWGASWLNSMMTFPLDVVGEAANEEAVFFGEKATPCYLSSVNGGDPQSGEEAVHAWTARIGNTLVRGVDGALLSIDPMQDARRVSSSDVVPRSGGFRPSGWPYCSKSFKFV
jgi:hypothetical protein